MRPVPLPEPYRSELEAGGARFVVFAAPSGDLFDPEVKPVEAAVRYVGVIGEGEEVTRSDQLTVSVVIALEPGDIDKLLETGMFEFGVWGTQLPVFFFHALERPEPEITA